MEVSVKHPVDVSGIIIPEGDRVAIQRTAHDLFLQCRNTYVRQRNKRFFRDLTEEEKKKANEHASRLAYAMLGIEREKIIHPQT